VDELRYLVEPQLWAKAEDIFGVTQCSCGHELGSYCVTSQASKCCCRPVDAAAAGIAVGLGKRDVVTITGKDVLRLVLDIWRVAGWAEPCSPALPSCQTQRAWHR
jgi:hypothetical protein